MWKSHPAIFTLRSEIASSTTLFTGSGIQWFLWPVESSTMSALSWLTFVYKLPLQSRVRYRHHFFVLFALSLEGYSYRFDRLNANNTKKWWRYRIRDCNGSLYTNVNHDNADIVELSTGHRNHCIPDPVKRVVEEAISDLKVKIAGCDFHMFSSTNNNIVIISTEENIRRVY